MKRFFFFGMNIVPEIKHNTIVSTLNAKLTKANEDIATQKKAYMHLADELEALKKDTPSRGKNGRFVKRSK